MEKHRFNPRRPVVPGWPGTVDKGVLRHTYGSRDVSITRVGNKYRLEVRDDITHGTVDLDKESDAIQHASTFLKGGGDALKLARVTLQAPEYVTAR